MPSLLILPCQASKLFQDAQGQADARNRLLAAELGKGELALAQKLHKYTFN